MIQNIKFVIILFSCIPCPSACECNWAGSCSRPDEDFSTETLMKATIGAILGACMLCCLVLALIVFRQRKCKVGSRCRRQSIRRQSNYELSVLCAIPDHCHGDVDHFRDNFIRHFTFVSSGKYMKAFPKWFHWLINWICLVTSICRDLYIKEHKSGALLCYDSFLSK